MALKSNSVYGYVDLSGKNVFALSTALAYKGEWLSSTTYVALDAVFYDGSYYVCLATNANNPPTYGVSSLAWSLLVFVKSGTTTGHTADEAFSLASDAMQIAQTGSNTAVQALEMAIYAGSHLADVNGSYVNELFAIGTNYTDTQVSVTATDGSNYASSLFSSLFQTVVDTGTMAAQPGDPNTKILFTDPATRKAGEASLYVYKHGDTTTPAFGFSVIRGDDGLGTYFAII